MTGLILPLPTQSSSAASTFAEPGRFIAAHRNGLSTKRPSRFHGHVFMHRPHIAPASLVMRYVVHFWLSAFHAS